MALVGLLGMALGACGNNEPGPVKHGGANAKPATEQAPAPPATTADLVERIRACMTHVTRRHLAGIGTCYADTAVVTRVDAVPPSVARGRATLLAQLEAYFASFVDTGSELRLILVKDLGEVVTVGLTSTRQSGPFLGRPGTGAEVGMLGASQIEIDDRGQIAAERLYFDQQTWFAQSTGHPAGHRPVWQPGRTRPEIAIAQGSQLERENLAAVRRFQQARADRDREKSLALIAENARMWPLAQPDDLEGATAIGGYLDREWQMSSDLAQTPQDSFAAGSYAVARTRVSGTHDGPLADGTRATGKSFALERLEIFKLAHGRIVEWWLFENGLALATQLGLTQMTDTAERTPAAASEPVTGEN